MVFFAKGATPGAWYKEWHIPCSDSVQNCLSYSGWTDGRTDDGQFNSPPISLREGGGQKYHPLLFLSFHMPCAFRTFDPHCSIVGNFKKTHIVSLCYKNANNLDQNRFKMFWLFQKTISPHLNLMTCAWPCEACLHYFEIVINQASGCLC